MRVIPVIHCRNVQRSLTLYRDILGFQKKFAEDCDDDWVLDLVREGAEIQLSQHGGDGAYGCAVNIRMEGPPGSVDALFREFTARGLNTDHPGSPVHQGPTNQSWGMREFYVTDEDGNTLRFGEPIE